MSFFYDAPHSAFGRASELGLSISRVLPTLRLKKYLNRFIRGDFNSAFEKLVAERVFLIRSDFGSASS